MYTRDWNGPGSHGGLGNNFDSILDNEELGCVGSDTGIAYIEDVTNDLKNEIKDTLVSDFWLWDLS